MKKIVAIMMLIAILTGCSGGKETTIFGKGESNGMAYEIELVSKGDKVEKLKEVIHFDLKKLGLTSEQVVATMAPTVLSFKSLKGVECKTSSSKDTYTITTVIECEKVDMSELHKVGLIEQSSELDYISFKKTKEQYEKAYKVIFEENKE